MFTEEQKKRLAELMKKSALSDAETVEKNDLLSKAKSAGFEWSTEKSALIESKSDEGLDVAELKSIIETSCKTAIAEADEAKIKSIVATAVDEALKKQDGKKLTQEQVKSIMVDSLKEVRKSTDDSGAEKGVIVKGVDFKKMFSEALEEARPESKMQHEIEIPTGVRKGNLPVAFKQILNVCTSKPMNDGIEKGLLEKAAARGERDYEYAREKCARYYRMVDKAFMAEDDVQRARYLAEADERRKDFAGFQTTASTEGANFLARDLSTELLMRMFLESRIAQRMGAAEVNMPTDPFDYPLATTRPSFYLTGEAQDPIESKPGTGKTTLTTSKMTGYVQLTYEIEEDSIVPVLPFLRDQLGKAASSAYEDALINGDDSTTHMDSDTAAVTRHVAKAWKGFRKLAIAGGLVSSFETGGISKTNLRALRKVMKKYGIRPSELGWIVGPNGYNDMLGIKEVYTKDLYSAPVIETGALERYEQIEIIMSESMRENLNASGVYDGTTATKGGLMLVNFGGFVTGRRRQFMLEMDTDIKAQTRWLVASFRKAFTPIETPSSTIPVVALGYNYDA